MTRHPEEVDLTTRFRRRERPPAPERAQPAAPPKPDARQRGVDGLTDRQRQCLEICRRSYAARGIVPSRRELAAAMGVSLPRAQQYVEELARLGCLAPVPIHGDARGYHRYVPVDPGPVVPRTAARDVMVRVGRDPEALRAQAGSLRRIADELDALAAALEGGG